MGAPDPIPFDSQQFVKRMTEAGMPLAQAEALADEQGVTVNTNFATKQDTGELKHRLTNVERDVGELRQDTGELKHRLTNVERDVGELRQDTGELKHRLTNVERDVGELKTGLAVVRAELGMVKWMVSGIGAGMLLLLVRTFWPI